MNFRRKRESSRRESIPLKTRREKFDIDYLKVLSKSGIWDDHTFNKRKTGIRKKIIRSTFGVSG